MDRRALILPCLLFAGSPSIAHQGGITGYAAIDIRSNALHYRLTLSQLPPAALAASRGDLAAALAGVREGFANGLKVQDAGRDCAVANVRVDAPSPGKESVALEADVVCQSPITQLVVEDRTFQTLGTDLHTLARITWPGGESQFAFSTETPRLELGIAAPAPLVPGFWSFLRLGVGHILTGYDHLLFLLALLLLPSTRWEVVRMVTAFTLAHSVTLGLTALELITLPARLVETAIALSIALVAGGNAWRASARTHRAWVAGLLGLVHGCGFADLLLETGLPAGHRVSALLGFNLGVEVGQLVVVMLLLPLLGWASRRPFGARLGRQASQFLCVFGLALAVFRAFF